MSQSTQPPDGRQPEHPSIVGRERERRLLHEALEDARVGRGRVVLIGGEAGIGKTTLVEALAEGARVAGALVLTSGCYDLTATPPYGAWLDLADRERSGGSPLSEVLSGSGAEISSEAALFATARAMLAELAAGQPLLLVLEDLHWSDPASLALLRFIGRELASLSVLLVGTYRADELTRRHPLFHLLPLLVREAQAARINLRRFDSSEVRTLVTHRFRLSASDEDRLVAYLVEHTEGNALFLDEVLRTLEDGGFLTSHRGIWTLNDVTRVPVPPLVNQVIEGRLARLGDETRAPLAIAAVIGQEVPLAVWQAVADLADDAMLATIERAVEARFIEASSDGTSVRFVHALIREALYESILPPRRRLWHRLVAERLASAPRADPGVVAHHFQQAGDPRAAEWLIRAGEAAERAYAWTTAAARFEAALPLLEADPDARRLRGWMLLHLGRLLRYAAAADSVGYLEAAGRVAREIDDRALAALAQAHAGMVRGFLWDARRGTAELEAAVAAQDDLTAEEWADAYRLQRSLLDSPSDVPNFGDPHDLEVATITSQQKGLLVRQLPLVTLRYRDAVALGEAYVGRIEATDSATLLRHTSALEGASWIDAYTGFGEACAILGRVDAALDACATAEALYRAAGHHASIVFMAAQCAWLIELPYQADDPVQRARWLAIAEAGERHTGGIYGAGWSPGMTRLPMLVLGGEWAGARKVAANMIAHQPAAMAIMAEVALGTIALAQGDREAVLAIVRKRLPAGPDSDPAGTAAIGAFHLARLAAAAALDGADLDTARAWLAAHDRWLDASGRVLGRAESQLLRARLDALLDAWDQAEEAAWAALARASQPRQPLALLSAHRLLGELATRRQHTEQAEQELMASLHLADTCAAPFERALTLLALADLRVAQGRPDDARTLAEEGRVVCEPLSARPTLARVDALLANLQPVARQSDLPAGLTPREVEVLRLVAQGLTDAEVAEQLFLARRTVNTHLTSIYTKLGVSSRAAATRFAVENGLT